MMTISKEYLSNHSLNCPKRDQQGPHYPIMALADQLFNVRHVHTNLGIFVRLHFFQHAQINRSFAHTETS